jgi:3-oxoacyl-[acyl-carrier protein] reductase
MNARANDSGNLDGKVAFVTGAGSGMGRAHCLALARGGAHVAVQDIDGRGAEETAELVRAAGGAVSVHVFDIAERAQIEPTVAAIARGHGAIGILVNNAGIGGFETIADIDEARFDRMMAVHVKAAFACVQACAPAMQRRGAGKIINISSRWAQVGNEFASHYCAAKAALLGLTKAWAKELAPWNIQVNAVAPGGVWTAMALAEKSGSEGIRAAEKSVPLGRWAQPEEIANLVAFLASSQSDFITGQVVSPNGGASIIGF